MSRLAVVTATTLVARAWQNAFGECEVLGPNATSDDLTQYGVIVFEVAGMEVLERVLPLHHVRCIWVHAGITPAQVRRARRLGVELLVHRNAGLQPLRDAMLADPRSPTISLLGGANHLDTSGADLSFEDVLVLRLLSRGATTADVRRLTGMTASRLEQVRQSVLEKLQVRTTGEAMARAVALGIVRRVDPQSDD
jgi:DNA-binding NarL/FixJ family response regulator